MRIDISHRYKFILVSDRYYSKILAQTSDQYGQLDVQNCLLKAFWSFWSKLSV